MHFLELIKHYLLYFLLGVSIGGLIFAFLSFYSIPSVPNMGPKLSMMSLTDFDRQKAIEKMDKNHDGKCDFCGMPVQMCIDNDQLECNMDPDAKIGVLGSHHIHADWKIFISGRPYDFSSIANRHERQMHGDSTIKDTSAFMHIHPAQLPEKAGNVLHMHATGVPLSLFFESVGMNLTKDCLKVLDGASYCNEGESSLKLFVNGKENYDFGDYVFDDLDKILIAYGSESENEINKQFALITGFSKIHSND